MIDMLPREAERDHSSSRDAQLTVERLTEIQFDRMRDEWNAVLAASRSDSPFLRWEWIHTWWDVFKHRRQLYLLAARDGATLVGLAPFYVERGWPSPARVLKFCSADDLYPDYLDVIARGDLERDVGQAFAEYVASARSIDVMILDNALPGSVVDRWFIPAATRYVSFSRVSSVCPVIRLGGTFDGYLKDRFNGKKRRQLDWQVRQAIDQHGMELRAPRSHEEAAAAIEHLFELHDKRARQKGLDSSFTTEPSKTFHRRVAALLFPAGIADLQILWKGDQPVAAHYHFVYRDRLYFFQSGLDPQWDKLSVGTSMTMLTVRLALENGTAEYDFLKGGERYKKSWATGERTEYEFRLFRRGIVGNLSAALFRARLLAKRAVARLRRSAASA